MEKRFQHIIFMIFLLGIPGNSLFAMETEPKTVDSATVSSSKSPKGVHKKKSKKAKKPAFAIEEESDTEVESRTTGHERNSTATDASVTAKDTPEEIKTGDQSDAAEDTTIHTIEKGTPDVPNTTAKNDPTTNGGDAEPLIVFTGAEPEAEKPTEEPMNTPIPASIDPVSDLDTPNTTVPTADIDGDVNESPEKSFTMLPEFPETVKDNDVAKLPFLPRPPIFINDKQEAPAQGQDNDSESDSESESESESEDTCKLPKVSPRESTQDMTYNTQACLQTPDVEVPKKFFYPHNDDNSNAIRFLIPSTEKSPVDSQHAEQIATLEKKVRDFERLMENFLNNPGIAFLSQLGHNARSEAKDNANQCTPEQLHKQYFVLCQMYEHIVKEVCASKLTQCCAAKCSANNQGVACVNAKHYPLNYLTRKLNKLEARLFKDSKEQGKQGRLVQLDEAVNSLLGSVDALGATSRGLAAEVTNAKGKVKTMEESRLTIPHVIGVNVVTTACLAGLYKLYNWYFVVSDEVETEFDLDEDEQTSAFDPQD